MIKHMVQLCVLVLLISSFASYANEAPSPIRIKLKTMAEKVAPLDPGIDYLPGDPRLKQYLELVAPFPADRSGRLNVMKFLRSSSCALTASGVLRNVFEAERVCFPAEFYTKPYASGRIGNQLAALADKYGAIRYPSKKDVGKTLPGYGEIKSPIGAVFPKLGDIVIESCPAQKLYHYFMVTEVLSTTDQKMKLTEVGGGQPTARVKGHTPEQVKKWSTAISQSSKPRTLSWEGPTLKSGRSGCTVTYWIDLDSLWAGISSDLANRMPEGTPAGTSCCPTPIQRGLTTSPTMSPATCSP